MFQAGDVVETDFEGFLKLLRSKTRAFVSINDHEYYITHTDGYWRVQDCETLNDKATLLIAPSWSTRSARSSSYLGSAARACTTALRAQRSTRPSLPNGQIHRYSRVTAGAAPAPAVFFVDMLM